KYYFKAGSAGSDLLFGFDQCKSYRLILLQPLPPAIKGIRLNAVLLAERGHALPARFLLTYQLVPIVPPGLPHIFKCATSGDELGRAVHEPLTFLTPTFKLLFFASRAMDVIGIAATLYRKRGMKAMIFHLTTDDHIGIINEQGPAETNAGGSTLTSEQELQELATEWPVKGMWGMW